MLVGVIYLLLQVFLESIPMCHPERWCNITARCCQVFVALLGVLLGLVLLSIPTSYLSGLGYGEATRAYREEAAQILLDYRSQPDEALAKLGYGPERIKPYIPFLEGHGYSVFGARDTP